MAQNPAKKKQLKWGQAPGTPIYTGQASERRVGVLSIDYDDYELHELTGVDALGDEATGPSDSVRWVNVDGIHDVTLVNRVAMQFHLHPLVVEDVVNIRSRPKAEAYAEYLFLIAKQLHLTTAGKGAKEEFEVSAEQVSVVLGSGYLLTFQQRPQDAFDPVRARLRERRGRIRSQGADYLAYELLDAIVDGYLEIIATLAVKVESLEDEVLLGEPANLPRRVHRLRELLRDIRKHLNPLQTAVAILQRGDSGLVAGQTQVYVRDLADHVAQVSDQLNAQNDALGNILDTHLALAGQRLNEVSKVLTVVATIFIPLTCVTGLYGMNFDHMPELHWKHGYHVVLGFMLCTVFGLLLFFRRRRWI